MEKKYYIPLYRIKEFADFMGITTDTLLYYDKIGLFLPYKIEENSGYRYYSMNQLPQISQIIQLKSLDFSLTEIKKLLNGEFSFNDKLEIMQEKINKMQSIVNIYSLLDKTKSYNTYVKVIPEHYCISVKKDVKDYLKIEKEYYKLLNYLIKNKIKIKQPYHFYTRFYDDTFKLNNNKIEIFAQVYKDLNFPNIIKMEEQKYICTIHIGSYESLSNAYNFLNTYCLKLGIEITGFPIEQYIESFDSKDYQNQFITEICFPIK
ncbi:MAG: MerR family transcriptional regulator [Clostridia bacterium]|jgi:DNA-binding transcriptional MerR regulator|nr:MerR family transcriptional regulator [Clostridia bacterium]